MAHQRPTERPPGLCGKPGKDHGGEAGPTATVGRALLRQRPAATEQGEYVTAVNCLKEIALQQMIQTKKRFGKEDKYIA